MNDDELRKIWQALDTRITTINDRTKVQTMLLKDINKRLDKLEEKIKTFEGRWRI